MKKSRNSVYVLMIIIAAFAFNACGRGGGAVPSTPSVTSGSVITAMGTINPGDTDCPYGGIKVESGIDENQNGLLDAGEVDTTQKVCNGADGVNGLNTLVTIADEAAGANCSDGGKKIDVGLDMDSSGSIDGGEILSTAYVCNGSAGADGTAGTNGLSSLSLITDEAAGPNCANGGKKIQTGLDANANGSLDGGEVATTDYVCNGLDGTNGTNGADGTNGTSGLNSLVKVTDEAPGSNCTTGGKKIETGLDDNADDVLDIAEVDSTDYVCNGADGSNGSGYNSLMKTDPEPHGPNCINAGYKLSLGLDTNTNGVLEDSEVTSFNYLCNGLGATGPNNPSVNPGSPASILNGTEYTHTATASDSIDKDPIHPYWNFESVPAGSSLTTADITNRDTMSPIFTPDVLGHYVLSLMISDGKTLHGSYTVTLTSVSALSPQAPIIKAEPDYDGTSTSSVLLEWNPVVIPDGDPAEYQVYAKQNTETIYTAMGWISGTTYDLTIAPSAKGYDWYVVARDSVHTSAISPVSLVDTFDDYSVNPVPPAPTAYPVPDYDSGLGENFVNLTWSAVTVPDGHPVEYQVYVKGTGYPNFTPLGWITNTSRVLFVDVFGSYVWYVVARDAVHLNESSPSNTIVFSDVGSGSCPFLYVWDGLDFAFQADIFSSGKIGAKSSSGYFKPNPHDYYVTETTPADAGGTIEMRIVEERVEADYLDEVKLYAVDIPADRKLYATLPGFTTPFNGIENELHTVNATATPVPAVHVNTGADVSAELASSDNNMLILNEDRNIGFDYQIIELDLGDMSQAARIKLIINGISRFPNTAEGRQRSSQFGARTKIEVIDGNGQWVSVPASVAVLPKPPEFKRAVVVDITDAFITNNYRVRLTFLFQTYLDAVILDTSADESVTLVELPLTSAELRSYGTSDKQSTFYDLYEYVYNLFNPNHKHLYFPGAYTRFGDVLPLLGATDDMFVIFGGGDELVINFQAGQPVVPGMKREYLLYSNGYYKNTLMDLDQTVEPLPFAAMSGFPYDTAVEGYPDDAEHNVYRQEYNTRIE